MKDNTALWLVLGVVVFYFIQRKTTQNEFDSPSAAISEYGWEMPVTSGQIVTDIFGVPRVIL